MKKIICIILAVMMLAAFAACGKSNSTENKAEDTTAAPAADTIDLSQMSGTVVYSEVLNIMQAPDKYVGKNIKIKGFFSKSDMEASQQMYYFCVIPDATACCSQGIEFVVDGYEDSDYPENGTNIEVEGVYNSYQENGLTYYHLENATISEVTE